MPPKKCVKKTGLDKIERCVVAKKEDSVFDLDCEVGKDTGRCRKKTEKGAKKKKIVKKSEVADKKGPGEVVADKKGREEVVKKTDINKEGTGGFVSWNVAGIRACIKKGNMDIFLDKYDPDFLCLQEVKATTAQVEKEHPKCWERLTHSYPHYVWVDSVAKKGYAGVALFSKKPFLNSWKGIGKDIHDRYGRIITVEYPDYYLVTSYVPNSGSKLVNIDYRCQEWNPDFTNWIVTLQTKGGRVRGGEGEGEEGNMGTAKPVIVCGDLNVAHTKWDLKNDKTNWNKTPGFTQRECDGMDTLLSEAKLIDSFRQPKWSSVEPTEKGHYSFWSNFRNARASNSGWRIDYFLVSNNKKLVDRVYRSDILDEIMGSDHCPVRLRLNKYY